MQNVTERQTDRIIKEGRGIKDEKKEERRETREERGNGQTKADPEQHQIKQNY